MKKNNTFSGPLFIVGVPRSGTKLILSLLNNHSGISLPSSESQFIPELIKWRGKHSENPGVESFLTFFKRTNFYKRKSSNKALDDNVIKEYVGKGDVDIFVESILKYYSVKFRDFNTFNFIWGDKTPLYIRDVDLIKEIFPEAKFLHIVRDPRDVVLSYNKTWNKSLRGSAEKWRSIIEIVETNKYALNNIFLEIKYENLVDSTEKVLRNICDFLEISFEPKMCELEKSVEKFGDARQDKIASNNTKKYLFEFDKNQIKDIESIVKPFLVKKGYKLEFPDVEYKPLNKTSKMYYKISDFIKFLTHHLIKERGVDGVFMNISSVFRKCYSKKN